jgi:UDP-glucuronate 4-epimerase
MDYIEALKEVFGIKADKELLPLQPRDVPDIYADVNDLVAEFGYKPEMDVNPGVGNFVAWFKQYHSL